MNSGDDFTPDEDLVLLVSKLCHQQLSQAECGKLEDRLRNDPEAMRYCAERLRFDAELEHVFTTKPLKWSETRSISRTGSSAWELRFEKALQFGGGDTGARAASTRQTRQFSTRSLLIPSILVVGATLWIAWWRLSRPMESEATAPAQAPIVLKNPDFEEPNLQRSSSYQSPAILHWQDFHRSDALLVDLARKTDGVRFAHSGRNVVRMEEWDFLTQKLVRADGSSFVAVPNAGVRISGWALVESENEPVRFQASLRYVASPHPAMCQYDAVKENLVIQPGGWKRFSVELRLASDLVTRLVTKSDNVPFPEEMDLTGKELTLSIDNRVGSGGPIYLDDLKITELPSKR